MRNFIIVFKKSASVLYPEPEEYSPQSHTQLFKIHFNISFYSLVFQAISRFRFCT